jgi:hypothetical protein
MTAKPEVTKRERKLRRRERRQAMTPIYREDCRATIARLREAASPLEEFRSTLKRLRHRFSRGIAGRLVS